MTILMARWTTESWLWFPFLRLVIGGDDGGGDDSSDTQPNAAAPLVSTGLMQGPIDQRAYCRGSRTEAPSSF